MGILNEPKDMPAIFESRPSQVPGYGMGVWARQNVKQGVVLDFEYIVTQATKRGLHLWEVTDSCNLCDS